ncbi:hypothetical protein NKDENANG_03990 [Candidatus Entotheonellaceae bacterium PAL068K]
MAERVFPVGPERLVFYPQIPSGGADLGWPGIARTPAKLPAVVDDSVAGRGQAVKPVICLNDVLPFLRIEGWRQTHIIRRHEHCFLPIGCRLVGGGKGIVIAMLSQELTHPRIEIHDANPAFHVDRAEFGQVGVNVLSQVAVESGEQDLVPRLIEDMLGQKLPLTDAVRAEKT